MDIEKNTFGIDKYNSKGADSTSVTSADASPRDTAGNGQGLESFRGEFLFPVNSDRVLRREKNKRNLDVFKRDRKFLDSNFNSRIT